MKSFKKVAVTILAAVMMLLISTTVFAADSPVKTSFNASLTKKTVTYTGKKQQPKVVVKNEAGKTIKAKYYTVKVKHVRMPEHTKLPSSVKENMPDIHRLLLTRSKLKLRR